MTVSVAPRKVLPRIILHSEFPAEWCGVAVIAALDAIWAAHSGFRLIVHWHDLSLLLWSLVVGIGTRLFGWRRLGLISEYFVLTLLATVAFGVLSYLCMAASGPLVDARLQAADALLGFEWLSSFHWLQAHTAIARVLSGSYNSLVYEGLYFCVLFGLMDRRGNLREMFWLVFVAGLFTSAGAVFFPAFGPFKIFGLESHGDFLPDMERLRSGHDLTFVLSKMTGVVEFPSFHTTMALIYMLAFRPVRSIAVVVCAINLLMLISIPFAGGHYLVDMFAGAAVMIASFVIVKAWPRLRRLASLDAAAPGIGEDEIWFEPELKQPWRHGAPRIR